MKTGLFTPMRNGKCRSMLDEGITEDITADGEGNKAQTKSGDATAYIRHLCHVSTSFRRQ